MSGKGDEYIIELSSIDEKSATFSLPPDVSAGEYAISVIRGDESLRLGAFTLNYIVNEDIPDRDGMTIKGVVSSDGVGVPGVVVSDGFEVTETDENGIYYLPSLKKHGYVFISVPGNYEVANNKNLPQFFQRLTGGTSVEQKDFFLMKTDNSEHIVITMADWHLARRNDDVNQFVNGFLRDVNATIAEYKAQGVKVYGLTLGDMSWDQYWYVNNFALPEYLVQMHKVNCSIFNVIGNHDYDPYAAGDWAAGLAYKNIVGPSYYSFNLGDIHYIVLDDIEYINSGGAPGKVGARNYNSVILRDQMDWLEKDLATIKDKTKPVVIAMHIPLFSYPSIGAGGNQTHTVRLNNGNQLKSFIQDFSNVRVLSGHTHVNFTIEDSPSLMEYNTGAVCATWWWTGANGYAGNHICKDGSPGGYGVWEMDGTEMKSYYKSIGYEKEYQFRAYDLNKVHITAQKHAPKSTDAALAPYAGNYANSNNNNEVLINVWGYDSKWDVEVKENGTKLNVTRVEIKDPLHIISYSAKRLNVGATPTSSFVTNNTTHAFKVKASSPTSTLEIKVTDRFGRVYTESMKRPKEFTNSMR